MAELSNVQFGNTSYNVVTPAYVAGEIAKAAYDDTALATRVTAVESGKQDTPSFEMSRNDTGGNVQQVGTVDYDGVTYGLYEFYYRTGALPAADATLTYNFTNVLADYDVFTFMGAEGVTGNGHIISNGRTDGNNRLIVQQFSKNNKTITIRAYGDYTAQNAYLKVKFIGTKTV